MIAMTLVRVCSVNDVPVGTGRAFNVNGKEIALFNVQGKFYAIDQNCPHESGPLSEGDLNGKIVTCPFHALMFDLETGKATQDSWDASFAVQKYSVVVEGSDVKVDA